MSKKRLLRITLFCLTLGACTPNTSDLKFNDHVARSIASEKLIDSDYPVESQIGDRRLIRSTLEDLFRVTASDPDVSEFASIWYQGDFGGSCDLYEASETFDSATGTLKREFPGRECNSDITPVLPALSNPMRFALTTRRCERLIGGASTLRITRLMEQVFSGWSAGQAEQAAFAPTPDAIRKAYRIFYRLEQPSEEVIQALVGVAEKRPTQLGKWRSIMITLCMSPEWQQLGN
jgi:hypothetical protein